MAEIRTRKLDRREHDRTRELCEELFPEGKGAFLDYYYDQITDENEIYAAEDGGEPCAMLHLNPYEMHFGKELFTAHFIVAAGTREKYRRQGIMHALLSEALKAMYERGEAFTFLVPSDEAFYRKLGFGLLCRENARTFSPKNYRRAPALEAYPAQMADVPDLAWISERILKEQYSVYTKRTEGYFSRLLDEQEALRGEVVILAKDRAPLGYLVYSARHARVSIRELVVEPEYEDMVMGALADCFYYDESVTMRGFPAALETPETPHETLMLGRIVNLQAFVRCLPAGETQEFSFELKDELLPENSGRYHLKIDEQGGRLEMLTAEEPAEELTADQLLERLLPEKKVFLHETV